MKGEQVLSGGVILSDQAQRTMGGIREDYVLVFASPRPQEVDCGPWLIALYCQLSPIIFEMSAPITARRMRAFGYAIPRLFIALAIRRLIYRFIGNSILITT
jgi:hypothetical protein